MTLARAYNPSGHGTSGAISEDWKEKQDANSQRWEEIVVKEVLGLAEQGPQGPDEEQRRPETLLGGRGQQDGKGCAGDGLDGQFEPDIGQPPEQE